MQTMVHKQQWLNFHWPQNKSTRKQNLTCVLCTIVAQQQVYFNKSTLILQEATILNVLYFINWTLLLLNICTTTIRKNNIAKQIIIKQCQKTCNRTQKVVK